MVSCRMPVSVQGGGTAAAEPPASAFGESALHFGDVAEEARGASVVVVVDRAEAEAVLVDSFTATSDGVAFGGSQRVGEFRIGMVHLEDGKRKKNPDVIVSKGRESHF